ncbi:PDZ and LIM domain protein Zasp-like isoform X2 [Uloborus diversus]|uniref:PDZ and LIM domain protein Zasp-like isoform X2 n=1 Tax=Uloborus diversus TaxID=327109 RepID=UPI00240A3F62|nr:PDZ and LIM domain protein Zasp-like isoform X2 [Uloborus diversus]
MSAQTLTVKLSRGDPTTSWGFRLQGGKDFSAPLSVQRVNPGSLSEQAGLMTGDAILKIMGKSTEHMKHKEAQDTIIKSGNNFELVIQRGGVRVWKPTVTPIGDLPTVTTPPATGLYTKTSLAAKKQESTPIGTKHNVSPRPFAPLGGGKVLVNNQYNTPAALYSMNNIADTLSAHTEVLASGAKGINFMKEAPPVNKESAVYRMLMEEKEGSTDHFNHVDQQQPYRKDSPMVQPQVVTSHVSAPITKPASQTSDKPGAPNACVECGKSIIGVFVRIKDKSLHPECFKCSTCGTSLKNVGYFNVSDKLYCEAHAKLAAKIAASAPTYEPLVISQSLDNPVPNAASPTPQTPITAPLSPSAYRSVSPVPFHKPGDIHHVEAPQSPQPVLSPPVFKPNLDPPPFTSPASTSPFKMPTPQVAPPVPASNIPTSTPGTGGPGNMPSGVAMSAGTGSRPAPRRGRGQMKQQVGPGARIPICNVCGTPIRGPFILALGKSWCPDHFLCANNRCQRSLADVGFVEDRGQLYCENCYEAYLAPTCSKCASRIKGDCLNALNKQWHPNCFVCAYCHKPFGNSSFYMEDGQPYCEKDWNELFTTKCVGCGFPIEAGDRWVEALNNNYHSQCFRCTICNKGLEGQSFYAKSGKPFCKAHSR